jgi:hypothetical protein
MSQIRMIIMFLREEVSPVGANFFPFLIERDLTTKKYATRIQPQILQRCHQILMEYKSLIPDTN